MARRLTFEEFRSAIARRAMPPEKLAEYVQFDPASPVPKLVFRADALTDRPPADYDVDEEIYRLLRALDDEEDARLEAFSFVGQKAVVAEGDSWFNLPPIIRPPAIADWIRRNGRFRMKNIAHWGHTLEMILEDKEYLPTIASTKPECFMFSAGGNDMQVGLAAGAYIHAYDPARPADKYLTNEGEAALADIERGYRGLFAELSREFPSVRVFCHGYDYPRPLVGDGVYIGQYLRKQRIPDDLMAPIMAAVINKLNDAIQRSTQSTAVEYLDCRRITEQYTWYDDMHPDRDGFLALAVVFEERMGRARILGDG